MTRPADRAGHALRLRRRDSRLAASPLPRRVAASDLPGDRRRAGSAVRDLPEPRIRLMFVSTAIAALGIWAAYSRFYKRGLAADEQFAAEHARRRARDGEQVVRRRALRRDDRPPARRLLAIPLARHRRPHRRPRSRSSATSSPRSAISSASSRPATSATTR